MSDITKEQVVEWLSGQSVIEIADLVKELEEKWGVSAAAPAAVAVAAPAGGGGDGGDAAAEDKTEFDVILTGIRGQQKNCRDQGSQGYYRTGPQGSKRTSRRALKPVKEGVSKDEAEEVSKKLEAAGAKAEIK